MKPAVLIVGADRGGVGKTTIARTLLDYLAANNTIARAFDTEYPRGTLKRFHPSVTEIVDITSITDQMKILDTLSTSGVKLTVIDLRAGQLLQTLKAFTDAHFFDEVRAGEVNFALFHVLGSSVVSLEEIADILPYAERQNYFAIKNFINETSFFEYDPDVYEAYFKQAKGATEVNIPKLNETAYEQIDQTSASFANFIKNRTAQGQIANNSMVLRGYVRTWINQVFQEYDRIKLLERLS